MCCFDIIDAVGNLLKTVVACVCCLLIGGPVLITFGTIFITQGNGLDEFKRDVASFDPAPLNAWTGTINNNPATVRRVSLNVMQVKEATSVFAEASIDIHSGSTTLEVSVNINTVAPFKRSVSLRSIRKSTYTCVKSQCTKSFSLCSCSRAHQTFRDNCRANGGAYTSLSSECQLGMVCSECIQDMYLSTLYLVAREVSQGRYEEDTSLLSAKYDFSSTANDYVPQQPSRITVRLYSNKDPFISLQRLTKGGNEFDDSQTVGIVMVVLGSLLLLLEIAACTALICFCLRRKNKPAGTAAEPAGPPPAAVPSGYGYGQPPPAAVPSGYGYGQPPPAAAPSGYGYGQPPPAAAPSGYGYGQPPPAAVPSGYGYGQPPPAAVPSGYGYGQPPPAAAPSGYGYGQPPPAAAPSGYGYGQPPPAAPSGYVYGQPMQPAAAPPGYGYEKP